MKPILLVQYRTDQSQAHEQQCLLQNGKLDTAQVVVVNPVTHTDSLDLIRTQDFSAVIIGGSGEFQIPTMPAAVAQALEAVRPVIDDTLATNTPLLGMCFGHQILAWHFGVPVVTDPEQSQVGSYPVTLTEEGSADPLFAGVASSFTAQHGHKDTIQGLPSGAIHLASGPKHTYNGFKIGSAYGLQFHPELTLDNLLERLTLYPEYLKGKTVDEIRDQFSESPDAPQILQNFLALSGVTTPQEALAYA